MKKLITLSFALIFSLLTKAQIAFEKGYFIDNQNNKTECFIKNIDWKNNPTAFLYKTNEGAEPIEANIEFVKEFGIYNFSRYIRQDILVDLSSDKLEKLTHNQAPTYTRQTLFLEVLIDGSASLYYYRNSEIRKYFYSTKDSAVTQLLYRRYKKEDQKIVVDNFFRHQLLVALANCEDVNLKKVNLLDYSQNELVSFFAEYNACVEAKTINYAELQKVDHFNMNLRPALRFNNFDILHPNDIFSTDFGVQLNATFGVEFEYILPINHGKWSVLVEPTYNQFVKSITRFAQARNADVTSSIDYKSVELPVGLRYYMLLNENSKLFINASYLLEYNIKTYVEFTSEYGTLINRAEVDDPVNTCMVFGAGYKYKDRYSLEMRYFTNKQILMTAAGSLEQSQFNTLAVVLGYTLF